MGTFRVRAGACEGTQARHGTTESPSLAHIETERARGHLSAGGSDLAQENEVVLLQPTHGRRRLLHACLTGGLMHGSQYLACSRMYLTAFVHEALLLSRQVWDSVHVLRRAQGLGPGPAELEDAVVFARLSRPGDTHDAAEGDSQKKVKHGIVQDVVLRVCVQVKRL